MTFLGSLLLAGATAFLGAGCGNTVVVTGSGGGATTGKTSATVGASTTGTANTTSTGNQCAAYDDQKGQSAVVVRFVNQSGLPIYLPTSCDQIMFQIQEVGTSMGPSYVFDHSCLQTCHDLQTQAPIACGACAPTSILLAAGATRDVTWDGTGLQSGVSMPSSCYLMPEPTCSEVVAAAAGTYAFNAVGYSSCGTNCACDASGLCHGNATGQQATANQVQTTFPGQALVQVVFGPCAFPCPNG